MGGLGRWADAEPFHRLCLGELAELRRAAPESLETYDLLARSHEHLGRCLIALGRPDEALESRRQAERLRAAVAGASPSDPQAVQSWADSLNDLAWLLANGPDPALRAGAEAVAPAEQAVILDPGRATFWNTLGVAYYRCGRLEDAVATLAHAATLDDDGSAGYTHLFLAMAHHDRGDRIQAAALLAEARARLASRDADPRTQAYLAEASALMERPPAPTSYRDR
jgi:tetratricopeptide (TPR) repeat protein